MVFWVFSKICLNYDQSNRKLNALIKRLISKGKMMPLTKFLEKFLRALKNYDNWWNFNEDNFLIKNKKIWKLALKFCKYTKLENQKQIAYVKKEVY